MAGLADVEVEVEELTVRPSPAGSVHRAQRDRRPTASVAVATTIPAVRNSRLDIPLPSTSQANHPER